LIRIASALLLITILLANGDVLAAAPVDALHPYRAEYEVLRNGKSIGRAEVNLARGGGDTWELTSHTRGTEGLARMAGAEIVERSTLRLVDGAIETVSYDFRQDAAWRTRERRVEVDAAGGRILSRDRRGDHVFPYQRGVIDRQAVSLVLARDLARGTRGEATYLVVDRDEFGPERYRIGPEETVEVPAGALRAYKVERVRRGGPGRATASWLGAQQGFLPVRMLQTEPDGDSFEMRLVSLRR
jgi:hypothetical protein